MIWFGKTYIEGFGSIRQEIFDWGILGLNILQAPNGFGKTKFINALVWCLYGKTLSGSVETWNHLRDSSYKGVKVSQEVIIDSTNIKITRYKEYTKYKNNLILEVNGEIPKKLANADKATIQKEIEELLGYSYDLFKNSIIFGQKLKRIISETGPNKKKVFDEAFNLTYLPKAKKIADEKLREYRNEEHQKEIVWYDKLRVVESMKAEVEAKENMVKSFEDNKKEQIRELNHKSEEIQEELNNLLEQYPNIEDQIKAYIDEQELFEKDLFTKKEINDLEAAKYKKQNRIELLKEGILKIEKNIKKYQEDLKNIPDNCPRCGAIFSKEMKEYEESLIKKSLEDEQKNLKNNNKQIRILNGQIKGVENELASAQKIQELYSYAINKQNELEAVENDIRAKEEKINDIKEEIKKVKNQKLINNIDELNVELRGHEEKLGIIAKELREIRKEVSAHEWVIKDPLSNSGIKAYVFNLMLDDINERLEFYTKYIGFQVAFFIDMKSANKNLETYVFINDNPVPYDDLSGGQQQSVDVATAFAIHDIVSGSKECNLLIMDEVFESLDKNNIEIIAEVIQDKAKDKCLWLITHNPDFNPTNTNIIQVNFEDGVTSIS